jgi:hypothetical protein
VRSSETAARLVTGPVSAAMSACRLAVGRGPEREAGVLKKVLLSALFGAIVMMGSAQAGYLSPSTLPTPPGQAPPPSLSGAVTPAVPVPGAPGPPPGAAPGAAGPVGAAGAGGVGPAGAAGGPAAGGGAAPRDDTPAAERDSGRASSDPDSTGGSGTSGGSSGGSGGSDGGSSSGGSSGGGSNGGSAGRDPSDGDSAGGGGVRVGVCLQWLGGECVRLGVG